MAASLTRSTNSQHDAAAELSHTHRLERVVAWRGQHRRRDRAGRLRLRLAAAVCRRPRCETAFGWLLHHARSHEPLERAGELRDALETLAALPPRQARMIVLPAMGLRYDVSNTAASHERREGVARLRDPDIDELGEPKRGRRGTTVRCARRPYSSD